MLTESGGSPIGRVLTDEEQERLFKVAASNAEWQHVCRAVALPLCQAPTRDVREIKSDDCFVTSGPLRPIANV